MHRRCECTGQALVQAGRNELIIALADCRCFSWSSGSDFLVRDKTFILYELGRPTVIWVVVIVFINNWVNHNRLLVNRESRIGRDRYPAF